MVFLPLNQVGYEYDTAYPTFGCGLQAGPDLVEPVTILGLTKLTLDAVSFPLFFSSQVGLLSGFWFRPAQGFGRDAYIFFFEPLTVFPGGINAVYNDRLGVMTMKTFISLYMGDEVCCFMVGMPTQGIDAAVTIVQGDSQFWTKLHFSPGLAPDNGPHIRLVDTHDTVLTRLFLFIKHLLLLAV